MSDSSGTAAPPDEPASANPTDIRPEVSSRPASNRTRVLAIVAVVLAVLIGAVGLAIVLPVGSKTERDNDAVERVSNKEPSAEDSNGEKADKKEKSKDAAEGETASLDPTTEQLAADAYASVLDDASSYFAEMWYNQYPDSDITYTLLDITPDVDDGLPELLLMAHYSNVGLHSSGGERILPFVYDAKADKAVLATSDSDDEFELFAEPRAWVDYDASQRVLAMELRYTNRTDSTFYKAYIDGTTLVREEVASGTLVAEEFSSGRVSPSDRSLLDSLRDGSAKVEAATDEGTDALEDEHAKMRAEAEAQGRQVFEGTVRVIGAEEVSARTGVPLSANGASVEAQWRATTYVSLDFDEPTVVRNVECHYPGTEDIETNWIGLGESGTLDTAARWLGYDGRRVCVSCGDFWQSDGVSLFCIPHSDDIVLLYEL